MAVKQTSKMRPILNLSVPKNKSLNDATDPANKSKTSRNFSSHFHFVQSASHTTKNSSAITRQIGIYSTDQTFGKSVQVIFFEFLKTIQ
jgi:hypothetical protein